MPIYISWFTNTSLTEIYSELWIVNKITPWFWVAVVTGCVCKSDSALSASEIPSPYSIKIHWTLGHALRPLWGWPCILQAPIYSTRQPSGWIWLQWQYLSAQDGQKNSDAGGEGRKRVDVKILHTCLVKSCREHEIMWQTPKGSATRLEEAFIPCHVSLFHAFVIQPVLSTVCTWSNTNDVSELQSTAAPIGV
jgi:hypothetical protein